MSERLDEFKLAASHWDRYLDAEGVRPDPGKQFEMMVELHVRLSMVEAKLKPKRRPAN